MAATDLQHSFTTEIHLVCDAVVELNAESVGLVGRRQRQGHGWILLVSEVEEHHVIGAYLASHNGIEVLRKEFPNVRIGYQTVSREHVAIMTTTCGTARSGLPAAGHKKMSGSILQSRSGICRGRVASGIMWGTVVVLALVAMVDPVRSGTAILLLSRRRPMQNLLAFWVGGIATAVVVGLCVLFVVRDFARGVIQRVAFTAATASAGHIRIVIGVLALLLATALFTYRRGGAPSGLVPRLRTPAAFSRLSPRAQDGVEGGRLWVAFVAGFGSAIPWEYLVALTAILASGAGVSAQVSAVVAFAVLAFAVAEIPLISHLAAAARTEVVMLQVHDWVRARRRRILAVVVAVAGVLLLANSVGSG